MGGLSGGDGKTERRAHLLGKAESHCSLAPAEMKPGTIILKRIACLHASECFTATVSSVEVDRKAISVPPLSSCMKPSATLRLFIPLHRVRSPLIADS